MKSRYWQNYKKNKKIICPWCNKSFKSVTFHFVNGDIIRCKVCDKPIVKTSKRFERYE